MSAPTISQVGHFKRRRVDRYIYLAFFFAFALILFLDHSPFLTLPYFWDELGQFVPAALDIFHGGAWVPRSAVPNVHPPGVMAWLALIWQLTGYSIPATRCAMLLLSAFGVLYAFLLAIELCRELRGTPAFAAILLLLADPLFFTQSMMAQLDMPAMVFTAAGLLYFLQGRHRAAMLACTALVLSKETGLLLPLFCGAVLLTRKGQQRLAVYYAIPAIALAIWLLVLWRATGNLFGDPGFAHYNIAYALHPVRAAFSLIRRVYYLFVANFRWIGTIAIVAGIRRGLFHRPEWRIAGAFGVLHILLVSFLGGAELERYLLPVVPLVYIAAAAGWTSMEPPWRIASMAVMACGLAAGWVINPPWPFPYENNLAMADFVRLQSGAGEYLERYYPQQVITTAWPLTAALRRPEFGYVQHGLKTEETGDFHVSTFGRLNPARLQVLVTYSRTWEPPWGILRFAWVREFLRRFYEYEPQMTEAQIERQLGLHLVMRLSGRGQWVKIYSKDYPRTALDHRRRYE